MVKPSNERRRRDICVAPGVSPGITAASMIAAREAGDRSVNKISHWCENSPMESQKIIIEKHSDGYVAYPLGLKGVVVGEGDSYEEALADVQSAIRFHLETFGNEVFEVDSPVLEVFVAETQVTA